MCCGRLYFGTSDDSKEEEKEQRNRILYPGITPTSDFTEDDIVAMRDNEIKDKLRLLARAHLISYYTENADGLYQHFASQSSPQMINLMFKRGKFKAWVDKIGIASG